MKIVRYQPASENKRLGCFRGQLDIALDFNSWPEEEAKELANGLTLLTHDSVLGRYNVPLAVY